MSPHNIRNVLVLFAGFNAFALLVSSRGYTEWSIRYRNAMYDAMLHRRVNLERQQRADEIAEQVCRVLRPVSLVVANALAVCAVWSAWR